MVFRLLIFIKIDINWNSAESYGGSAPDQIPNGLGVFVYNQRFPGQVFDAETGLFQNWMREYNPRIGRYMCWRRRQIDPGCRFPLIHPMSSGASME